ncbi:MAG: hypothetical protein ACKVUT_08310 [Gaiella sp.]
MHPLSVSDARRRWADVFTQAVGRGSPVAIERGGDEHGLLIGFEELRLLLDRFPFTTETFFEEGAVSLWVPELALYGRGATFVEAQADLADEVRAYVDEFLGDARLYLRAPNRREHFPWVLRAYVAEAIGALDDVLAAPSAADGAAA